MGARLLYGALFWGDVVTSGSPTDIADSSPPRTADTPWKSAPAHPRERGSGNAPPIAHMIRADAIGQRRQGWMYEQAQAESGRFILSLCGVAL